MFLSGLFIFISLLSLFSLHRKTPELYQKAHLGHSKYFRWGRYGISPLQSYYSFYRKSLRPNLVRKNVHCNKGLLFVEPRDESVIHPLMIFNNDGHLVWMPSQSEFYNAKNFQVHNINAQNYIAFLAGDGNSYTLVSRRLRSLK